MQVSLSTLNLDLYNMAAIFKYILITIVIFFVWNILKRLFFNKFYNYFPHQQKYNQQKEKENHHYKRKTKNNLNWDAETVDYEEVKD